jgi:riboflavin synthase alpha subunit
MFTGIIEEIAEILAVEKEDKQYPFLGKSKVYKSVKGRSKYSS